MTCCHCKATARQFDRKVARRDVRRYHRKGPDPTTRAILVSVQGSPLADASLLDIGSGIGVLAHELILQGLREATLVEAAAAYLEVAVEETRDRKHQDQVHYVCGDFVDVVDGLSPADIVTLDRVVCCYPDYVQLLEAAMAKAKGLIALSYPRDRWYVRAVVTLQNALRRLAGNDFRTFVHPPQRIRDLVESAGFARRSEHRTIAWSIEVYERVS